MGCSKPHNLYRTMKLLKYLLISVLVFGIALSSPARTQTPPVRWPRDLSAALCMNNWNEALTIMQYMLSSPSLQSAERSQLVSLSTQIRGYQRAGTLIDQSEACEMAISPSLRTRDSNTRAQRISNTQSASSEAAANRRRRSAEAGDYRF